jgi:hypothetical protein
LTITGPAVIFALIDVVLFVVAARRPWIGLVVLLAGLPFNGILLDVFARSIGGTGLARYTLAGWHDALALGIVFAAAVLVLRHRRWPVRSVATIAVVVLTVGVAGLPLAPDLPAALYAYRTIFLPVAVMAAITLIAHLEGLPIRSAATAGTAVVVSGLLASAFAWWQVYGGAYGYLNTYFRTSAGTLPAAYSATHVVQPRAIGTFHSPNEFGAFLVLATIVALTPGILPLGRARPWIGVALGLALVLTFSRSAWVGAIVATVVIAILLGRRLGRPDPARLRAVARATLAPAVTFVGVAVLVLMTSGGARFLEASLRGAEPSAQTHLGAVQDVITDVINGPDESAVPGPTPGSANDPTPSWLRPGSVGRILVGDGLGTAGPKSTRFSGAEPTRHSEIWFLNFAWQVGLIGFALAGMLVLAILVALFRQRSRSWPAAAIGGLLALGAGAVFIPVLDEPAVSFPLWALIGIAIVDASHAGSTDAEPAASA